MENINKQHTSIKNWAADEQPREKMQHLGANALSRSELLAILINNGSKNKSAIDLARELLQLCEGSIHKLARLSVADMQVVKGLGPAKAITIKAALELAIRKEEDRLLENKVVIKSGKDAADYIRHLLQDELKEHFVVMFLNRSNRIVSIEKMSSGGIAGTVVDVRLIMKRAIETGASSLILSHNHPSGNLKPSKQDKTITLKLRSAMEFMDIAILDHLIVSDEGYYSFADEGEL